VPMGKRRAVDDDGNEVEISKESESQGVNTTDRVIEYKVDHWLGPDGEPLTADGGAVGVRTRLHRRSVESIRRMSAHWLEHNAHGRLYKRVSDRICTLSQLRRRECEDRRGAHAATFVVCDVNQRSNASTSMYTARPTRKIAPISLSPLLPAWFIHQRSCGFVFAPLELEAIFATR
jgi:hypothetical protein